MASPDVFGLLRFATSLISITQLTRDECGDWLIPGRRGNIYRNGDGYLDRGACRQRARLDGTGLGEGHMRLSVMPRMSASPPVADRHRGSGVQFTNEPAGLAANDSAIYWAHSHGRSLGA